MDIIDEILKLLIARGKALECNTAGYKYGLGHLHPHEEILRRYRELGGELLTVGSDGHRPEEIGKEFIRAESILKACGFRYYTCLLYTSGRGSHCLRPERHHRIRQPGSQNFLFRERHPVRKTAEDHLPGKSGFFCSGIRCLLLPQIPYSRGAASPCQ